jgi:cbb3-type cytochrome oxidase subunit 3
MTVVLLAADGGTPGSGGLLPTLSLIAALLLFVSIVAWVFVVVPRATWQRDARIPLEDAPVDPVATRDSRSNDQ